MKEKEIVINWHITEKCNYKCCYCFAKFAKYEKSNIDEIQYDKIQTEFLLNKVFEFFKTKYPNRSLRLNLAGGEPTLSKNLPFIIQKAYEIGYRVSLITNASLLSEEFIKYQAPLITTIGISIDSFVSQKDIGRISKSNKFLTEEKIKNCVFLFRKYNEKISIKINTVVNKYNFKEKFHTFITEVKPDKWKVFQALTINSNKTFCTKEEFEIFLQNHKNLSFSKENNEDMKESYIMIDPYGRFYQNTNKNDYDYSESILDISIEKAFNQIKFNFDKYLKRYQ